MTMRDVESLKATDVLRRGLKAVPKFGRGLSITAVLAVVATSGRVVVPIAIQQIIDRGFTPDGVDMNLVIQVVMFAAAVLLVTAVSSSVMHVRIAVTLETALSTLRVNAFSHTHRLSPLQRAEDRRGNLVSRVTSDVDEMSKFMAWAGLNLFTATIQFVVASVVMLAYSWRLAVVVFVVFLPFVGIARRFQRALVKIHYVVRQRLGAVFTGIAEMLAGAAVLKVTASRPMMQRRVDDAVEAHRSSAVKAGTLTATFSGLGELFAAVATASVVIAGVWLAPSGTVSAGTLVAFLFLITLFVEPVVLAAEVVNEGQTAVAGLRRVLDVLDEEPAIVDPVTPRTLPDGPLELRATDVSFTYPHASVDALSDVNVTIAAGQRVAVVGETGAGKSTFVKLVARFADPSAGMLSLSGVPIHDVALDVLRRRVVFLPQEDTLFDASVAQNVRVAKPDATDADIHGAFAVLGLDTFVASLPDGLATRVGERGAQLSVGERQLVALARAALADPDLLILDESTSALDPATDAVVAAAVSRLIAGRTALIVAHRLATAERADQILVFADGKLVEQGAHRLLQAQGGVYASMHQLWLDSQT